MTYTVGTTLIDNREDAIRAMIEEFLSANGTNSSHEIAEFIADDDLSEADLALALAAEIIDYCGGWLETQGPDDPEYLDQPAWAYHIRQIVGVKINSDANDDGDLLWDEGDAIDLERIDPSLVVRSRWHPRESALDSASP